MVCECIHIQLDRDTFIRAAIPPSIFGMHSWSWIRHFLIFLLLFFSWTTDKKMYFVVHITMALWVTATLFYGTKCKFLHFICHRKHTYKLKLKHTNKKNADEIKRESHCLKGAHYSQPFERLIFALFSGWFCFLFHPLYVCELWLCAYILLKTVSTVCGGHRLQREKTGKKQQRTISDSIQ